MPTPKFRKSKSKVRQRRAHDALTVATVSFCPNCGDSKRPHLVCASCGHYRGKQVMEPTKRSTEFEGEDFAVED